MTEYTPLQPTRDTDHSEEQKLAKKIKNFIYDPSDVIGSGFSSKVYKGINEQNNQQVAIKVIQLSKIQNQVQKYLLNNQINALRALHHKNILKTIDILMTKNNVYIVTQFCEFGDLQQMIKNNKKLQQKDALNIVKDIIQGYIAIEQKNIIHRDLKAANIFLSKTGAKIADFGFCEFIGQKKPNITYNVGSPAYMSPQSYKQNLYSNKSDIWGIGVILYEMLVGQTPDKNLTYAEMSSNLMNGQINCGPNKQVRRILLSCFRRDVKERTDARSFLQGIVNVIQEITQKEESRNAKIPDNKFFQNTQHNPTDQHRTSGVLSCEQNLKSPLDDKRIVSYSPSKLNNPLFKGQFQQGSKQYAIVQPSTYQPGSRAKREVLTTSGLVHTFSPKLDLNETSMKLKSNIAILQFIFRLFKYLSEVSIASLPYLKFFTFRHRSYVDQVVQKLIQQNPSEINNSELYKQFQFLKSSFDKAYLQRQNSSSIQSNYQLMNIMNKLANLSFIDTQCIKAYKQLIRKGSEQIQTEINQNRSNSYVLWDYLMLQYQLLGLYGQGVNQQAIVNQKINLQAILKEQPKNLLKTHIQLLRMKSRYLFQSGKIEFTQNHGQNNILLIKHTSGPY